ncbi:MAG: leucine-rich repeat domain-containing protein [Pirellulaceae bacterium]|jgi:hypothetical protein|nr:leucine-rich repeat domain-containing protein [Pirellulaceae bacterium]
MSGWPRDRYADLIDSSSRQGEVMAAPPAKSNRWFPRFSLRTLLLFTLVVGVAMGWKLRRVKKQREIVAWIHENGGSVSYSIDADSYVDLTDNPRGPEWMTDWLGPDFFDDVAGVSFRGSDVVDLQPLVGLKNIRRLNLSKTPVRDLSPLVELEKLEWLNLYKSQVREISPLAELPNLQVLDLNGTQVRDVTPLSGLTNLQELGLWHTPVRDLTPLAKLHQLEYLRLNGSSVGDVTPLSNLKNLERLYIDDTFVSDVSPLVSLTKLKQLHLPGSEIGADAVADLKKALPKCAITN